MSVPESTPHPTVVPKDDAKATLAAFAELGPQYSDEVVDAFLEKINERLVPTQAVPAGVQVIRDRKGDPVRDKYGRVQFAPVGAVPVPAIRTAAEPPAKPGASPLVRQVTMTSIILGVSIPLTAIAAQFGLAYVLIVWAGICIVSITQAWASHGDQGGRR